MIKALYRAARSTRKLLRKANRLSSGQLAAGAAHCPDFDSPKLTGWLGNGVAGNAETNSGHSAARYARNILGGRFFVNPRDIAQLMEQLPQRLPAGFEAVMRKVQTDVCDGLPIYASTGPALGANFPWQSLPTGPGQDGMYAKRPHRFAFAPRHAMDCLLDEAAAPRLRSLLGSWMAHAARGKDRFCYDSNLLVIQRILALSWTWAFLAARPAQESQDGLGLEWLVLQIIAADIEFLEPLLGQSTPNNHLLADWFAGWYLKTLFPELLVHEGTGNERLWEDELLTQTYEDGGSFEHSSHYHEFACEMGAAYLLLAQRNGLEASTRTRNRVKALLDFQCALTGPTARPVAIGNAVEDTLFPLDAGEAWCPGALREINRALFEPRLQQAPSEDITLVRAFWLLGGRLADPIDTGSMIETAMDFPQAGLHVMADPTLDARLLFRTGPILGSKITAGHMHADMLSLYMDIGGRPTLIDSGTYTYRKHSSKWARDTPNWRSYFAGPAAHNGLTIQGEDPLGTMSGDFRRTAIASHASTQYASSEKLAYVASRWQGPGAYHLWGRTCIHVKGEYWIVLNYLPNSQPAENSSLRLQTSYGSQVEQYAHAVGISSPGKTRRLCLSFSDAHEPPQILEGSKEPLGGWVSPCYGELLAAPQISFSSPAGQAGSVWLLSSYPLDRSAPSIVRCVWGGDGSCLLHIQNDQEEDWLIWQPTTHQSWSEVGTSLRFNGTLLWTRSSGQNLLSLAWLDGTSLTWQELGIQLRTANELPCDSVLTAGNSGDAVERGFVEYVWPKLNH